MQKQHLNENHPYFTTCQDVSEIMKPLQKLGIIHFNYTLHDTDGGRVYLTNDIQSQQMYLAKKCYLRGNTECDPSIYKSTVAHWDTLPDQTVCDEVLRSRKIDHGMYIIEPHDNYCEFFGFATTQGRPEIINTYLSKMDVFRSFTEYFRTKAAPLIQAVNKRKLILPHRQEILDFTNCIANDDVILNIKSTSQRVKLSTRQLEVIHEFLKGHPIKTIAYQLKVSPRTIETHLNNFKHKFSCKNKTELILKLSELT